MFQPIDIYYCVNYGYCFLFIWVLPS